MTPNQRIIIKSIEKAEMVTFNRFAAQYFEYIGNTSLATGGTKFPETEKADQDGIHCGGSEDSCPSTLVGILGAFKIEGKGQVFGKNNCYIILMENLFQDRDRSSPLYALIM